MISEPDGLLAEFESPEQLLEAVQQVRASGYRRVDAFTPFAIEGFRRSRKQWAPFLPTRRLLSRPRKKPPTR